MRYCVLYPETRNVHLIKDVGMIAYKLYKLYGVDSFVACYNNGEYNYLQNEVKGLKIDFIEKKHRHLINIFLYLKNNAAKIDVLQIFHITFNSVIYAFIYKFFNKNGVIFLKLDCSTSLLKKLNHLNFIEKFFLNLYLKKTDIIGVEQKNIYCRLKKMLYKFEDKLMNIPNGLDFDKDIFKSKINFEDKENIVLSVGRIGSPEKKTENIMEAFKNIEESQRENWKLVLIGPIVNGFENYIKIFFEKYPEMRKCIIFKGAIYDRNKLFYEYKKAKVFCLTSEYESFGFVLIESAAFGDVIISTRVGIADEIIKDESGIIVPFDDKEALSEALLRLFECHDMKKMSEYSERLCRKNFDWNKIVERLYEKIEELRGRNKNA